MIGHTISHYKILEKIGKGGMGVVYKARHLKLDSFVALKFLPTHLVAQSSAKERFIREAKAASSLEHPNIGSVHDIGETQDGRMYIVMSYYDGEPLQDKIERGPMELDEALDIAIQIASGLAKAHNEGIVHRDIKPENIIITNDGLAKIVDFGLAKLKGRTEATKTDTVAGTVSYMSPEQASGRQTGPSSDVFSLGVVLYELLTGTNPFKGDHDSAIVYSIVNVAPEPLNAHRKGLPEGFQTVINKALMKWEDERYPSAVELLQDLKRLREGQQIAVLERKTRKKIHARAIAYAAVALMAIVACYVVITQLSYSKRIMLAVLPFENLGPPEDDYFADGITEEITARLAGINQLGVIARTSVIQYKNTKKTIQQIGDELNVDYIVEGTIRWQHSRDDPGRVRVTPQLIKVSDATHLWANVYDELMTEIFDVQSDIAKNVVSALNIKLLDTKKQLVIQSQTNNLEAYDYYLRGKEYTSRGITHTSEVRLSIQLYEKAVELDPSFASAWAQLSRSYTEQYWHGSHDAADLARAKHASEKAMETGSETPDARVALASYYYHLNEYDSALVQLEYARELQPNNSDVLAEIGYIQRRQGRYDLASANIKKAFTLDPRSAILAINLGNTLLRVRNYAEAEIYFDRAISFSPDEDIAYGRKALLYMMRDGDTQTAQQIMHAASSLVEQTPWFTRTWAWVSACTGDFQAALDKYAIDDPSIPGASYYDRAAMYHLLGEVKLAQAYYDSARVMLEPKVASAPKEAVYHIGLGIAYAGLGQMKEAIHEGELAVRLAPISKDAHWNPAITVSLARIYTMTGEYELAIDQLEHVLSIPADLSAPLLRIDPTWLALRKYPRFQALAGTQ